MWFGKTPLKASQLNFFLILLGSGLARVYLLHKQHRTPANIFIKHNFLGYLPRFFSWERCSQTCKEAGFQPVVSFNAELPLGQFYKAFWYRILCGNAYQIGFQLSQKTIISSIQPPKIQSCYQKHLCRHLMLQTYSQHIYSVPKFETFQMMKPQVFQHREMVWSPLTI